MSSARDHIYELGGYRGIAAMSTVVFHVWQHYTTYGAEGVTTPVPSDVVRAVFSFEVIDLFFVLSAYLLTMSYARAAIDGESARPARVFLFRRAVRILPVYWAVVITVWASRNPRLPGDWVDLVEHMTFTQVFDQERIFYTVGAAWSMSLEVMFYLLLVLLGPVAIAFCRPLRRRGSRVALCATGCALLYAIPVGWVVTAYYVLGISKTNWPAYFGPQARFHAFAAGMLLAVIAVALGEKGKLRPWPALMLRVTAVAGLCAVSWLATRSEDVSVVFSHPVSSLLWMLLLISTLRVRERRLWHRILSARWLTGVGLVSYSLFLWHEPVMIYLDKMDLLPGTTAGFPLAILIVLGCSLPIAFVSYWVIEYPASLIGKLRDSSGRGRDFYPILAEPAAPPLRHHIPPAR